MQLRSQMNQFLQGWRRDLSPRWRTWLGNLQPNPSLIPSTLNVTGHSPVIPGRGHARPQHAPPHSHLFLAFDGIDPTDVRVVFLAQDPYPAVRRATGRAFEQGDLNHWTRGSPAATASMRRLVQEVADHRRPNRGYRRKSGGWPLLKCDIAQSQFFLPLPRLLFNCWQERGVMFLNTSLTFTQSIHLKGHMCMWAPFINGICWKLACQPNPTVFIVLGCKSLKSLLSSGIISHALVPSLRTQKTKVLFRFHPATHKFFGAGTVNLLDEINQQLSALGGRPINW